MRVLLGSAGWRRHSNVGGAEGGPGSTRGGRAEVLEDPSVSADNLRRTGTDGLLGVLMVHRAAGASDALPEGTPGRADWNACLPASGEMLTEAESSPRSAASSPAAGKSS